MGFLKKIKIKFRMYLLGATLLFFLIIVASFAYVNSISLFNSLNNLYKDSINPMLCLDKLSNIYSQSVIDTVHKVANKNISLESAKVKLINSRDKINEIWEREFKDSQNSKFLKSKNLAESFINLLLQEIDTKNLGSIQKLSVFNLYSNIEPVLKEIEIVKKLEHKKIIKEDREAKIFIENINFFMLGITLVAIVLSLIIINLITKSIVEPLRVTHDYMLEFMEFITFKRNTVRHIEADGDDIISSMINRIDKVSKMLLKQSRDDMKVVGEMVLISDKIKRGYYHCRVNSETSNPQIDTLQKTFNDMLNVVNSLIGNIQLTLKHYTEDDYTNRIDKKNLVGQLGDVVDMINNLGDVLSQSAKRDFDNGRFLKDNADLLSSSVDNLTKSTTNQAENLQMTASAVEEITAGIKHSVNKANEMSEIALTTKNQSKEGKRLVEQTKVSMEEISKATDVITEAILVIDSIAFQTNILSLNAAVEAATAGDAGKGFAVVAQEVRNLASRSAEAAKKIKELVEEAKVKSKDGQKIATDMLNGFNNLDEKIKKTTYLVEDVTNSAKEQMIGIEQINDAISHLDGVTQENSQVANKIKKTSDKVNNLSVDLLHNVKSKKFLDFIKEL